MKKYLTAKDILGVLKQKPEEAEEFKKRVQEVHEKSQNRMLDKDFSKIKSIKAKVIT